MAKKIYLSPSNQNKNIYAYGKTNEMVQCNKIAESCEVYLKKLGFEVKRAPMGQNMNASINESNAWDADVHICIHTNAGGGRGCEVFTHKGTSSQLKYAKPVYEALSALTTNSDRGLKTANFAELSRTNAVCVYCECEFHDNETYAKWIVEHTDELGLAIANGIAKAEGKNSVTKVEDKKPTTTVKPSVTKLKAGQAINLRNEPLYATAYTDKMAGTIYGTYYVFDNVVINGRIRITTYESKVGVKGQVTGYIDAPQTVHKVVSGDTLSKIANKYGTTAEKIYQTNRTKYPKMTMNYIVVGWELTIPK